MKSRLSRLTILVVAILVSGTVSVWAERPWYAERLEKLGFYVYGDPFKQNDFTVERLDGKLAKRSSLTGNVVLLNFWATWCPPCKEEIPSIQNLAKSLEGKAFTVMAVSVGENKSTVSDFVREKKIDYPIYLDRKNLLRQTYASRGIPTTYILDKKGYFIAAMIGSFNYSKPEVIALFSELSER